MKLPVTTLSAEANGDIELDPAVFGLEPRKDILHRMVRWQLAKRRAGTHNTLVRNEIARTKSKWGRQKGGGRARHGAKTAGIFVGGAKAHGPKTRDHEHDLPKKVRSLALKHALSAKAAAGEIIVIEEAAMPKPKTKELVGALAKLEIAGALIIGGDAVDGNFARAARNIPRIDVLPVQGINVYDVLRSDKLVLTRAAIDALHARFKAEGAPA